MSDERGDEEKSGFSLSFSLPPFQLPDFFPEGFRPNFRPAERVRVPGASARTILALAVLVDIADAALALEHIGGPARALVVAVFGLVLLGRRGLAQAWELLPTLLFPPLAAAPTLTALALLQFRGEFDVLGGGHPEHVDGDAERERHGEQRDE